MISRRLMMIAVAMSIAACAAAATRHATTDDEALAEATGNRVPGKAEICIDQTRVSGPEPIGDHTVIYREGGRRLWVSNLRAACPALRGDNILVVEVHGNQICRNDRFEVVARGSSIPSGFCFFGDFTPYERAAER